MSYFRRFGLGFALCLALVGTASAADPIRVYAAGSLSTVLKQLIAASGRPEGAVVAPVFGPAGALRQRLPSGEFADLFASTDLSQPRALAGNTAIPIVPFARNRMCVLAKDSTGLTADTLLDRMLSPALRLATSTPGVDPGGDYALAVFDRAEVLHPGARATLVAKSLLLLGGPATMVPSPGHSTAALILLTGQTDAVLYYRGGAAAAAQEASGLVSIPLPDSLEVGPLYGLAVLSGRAEAAQLALFMVSERGQAILAQGGPLPLVAGR